MLVENKFFIKMFQYKISLQNNNQLWVNFDFYVFLHSCWTAKPNYLPQTLCWSEWLCILQEINRFALYLNVNGFVFSHVIAVTITVIAKKKFRETQQELLCWLRWVLNLHSSSHLTLVSQPHYLAINFFITIVSW